MPEDPNRRAVLASPLPPLTDGSAIRTRIVRAGLCALLCFTMAAASGAETPMDAPRPADEGPRFQSAWFGTGPESLLQRLGCPTRVDDEERVIVYCQARVREDGSITLANSFCFPAKRTRRPYSRATGKAMRASRFEPASIDGNAVEVYFTFRVVFARDDEECRLYALPNSGSQADVHGLAYVAPQEILSHGNWTTRAKGFGYPPNARIGILDRGVLFTISVAVDTEGNASDGRVDVNNDAPRPFLRRSVPALEKSTFIPGFVRGAPIAMRYYEILWAGETD